MDIADISHMLENGKINAFEYYNFFKRRSTQKITKPRSCRYSSVGHIINKLVVYNKATLNGQDTSKSSINDKQHDHFTGLNQRNFIDKDPSKLNIDENHNILQTMDYNQINLFAKSFAVSNFTSRQRYSLGARIKPSDMRYCSDKNRQNLVNKIIQEEKIKQIRQSLADCELYKDYKDGFDSEDERLIEKEIENFLPTMSLSMLSISSSFGNKSVNSETTISRSSSNASCERDKERTNSSNSNDSIRSNDILPQINRALFAAPHKLFTLKLSMIEEDTCLITKSLEKIEVEVSFLQDRFKSIEHNLNIFEINLKNIYESLQTILQIATGSNTKS